MSADDLHWRNCWPALLVSEEEKCDEERGNNSSCYEDVRGSFECECAKTPIFPGRLPVARVIRPANKMMINSGLPRRNMESDRMPEKRSRLVFKTPLSTIRSLRG